MLSRSSRVIIYSLIDNQIWLKINLRLVLNSNQKEVFHQFTISDLDGKIKIHREQNFSWSNKIVLLTEIWMISKDILFGWTKFLFGWLNLLAQVTRSFWLNRFINSAKYFVDITFFVWIHSIHFFWLNEKNYLKTSKSCLVGLRKICGKINKTFSSQKLYNIWLNKLKYLIALTKLCLNKLSLVELTIRTTNNYFHQIHYLILLNFGWIN